MPSSRARAETSEPRAILEVLPILRTFEQSYVRGN